MQTSTVMMAMMKSTILLVILEQSLKNPLVPLMTLKKSRLMDPKLGLQLHGKGNGITSILQVKVRILGVMWRMEKQSQWVANHSQRERRKKYDFWVDFTFKLVNVLITIHATGSSKETASATWS